MQIIFSYTTQQQQRISAHRRRVDTTILSLFGNKPVGVSGMGWQEKTEAIDRQAEDAILSRMQEIGVVQVRRNAGPIYIYTDLQELANCLHCMCLGGAIKNGMQEIHRYIEKWLRQKEQEKD